MNMKKTKFIYRSVFLATALFIAACEDLSEINVNENAVDQGSANPNMMMPTVMTGAATSYLDLGIMDIAGVVQHTQKTGWYEGHNSYDWTPRDWANWYGYLRTNKLLYNRAVELEWPFHQGVALTMRAFIFGVITDLWGDAPYTEGLQADEGIIQPKFDSQETIYQGIINDLLAASQQFAKGDVTGVTTSYDVYFGGDAEKWHRFANSLLLRYYMRLSEKNADLAKTGIEAVYSSGIYMMDASDDATMAFIGANASNSFPTSLTDDGTRFRNPKAAATLLDKLVAYDDPRLEVWFDPVRVQWVEDTDLELKMDTTIRRNGVVTNMKSITDAEYRAQKEADPSVVYTRHFNPDLFGPGEMKPVTAAYVGIPAGSLAPDYYNYNPTPGQGVENPHVSGYDGMYRDFAGPMLKARLMSAAETHFILAEAALKGWGVGDANTHYANGIRSSLQVWGVAGDFDAYYAMAGVAPDPGVTLEQVMDQKWIASWTAATEAWFDYRRTGLPALQAGPASQVPVLPVRFIYGDQEVFGNEANAMEAIGRLQTTTYSELRGANSQWSKPWIIQGTGKPW